MIRTLMGAVVGLVQLGNAAKEETQPYVCRLAGLVAGEKFQSARSLAHLIAAAVLLPPLWSTPSASANPLELSFSPACATPFNGCIPIMNSHNLGYIPIGETRNVSITLNPHPFPISYPTNTWTGAVSTFPNATPVSSEITWSIYGATLSTDIGFVPEYNITKTGLFSWELLITPDNFIHFPLVLEVTFQFFDQVYYSNGASWTFSANEQPWRGEALNYTPGVAPVPLPAAAWLFLTGLSVVGFAGWRRRREVKQAAPA